MMEIESRKFFLITLTICGAIAFVGCGTSGSNGRSETLSVDDETYFKYDDISDPDGDMKSEMVVRLTKLSENEYRYIETFRTASISHPENSHESMDWNHVMNKYGKFIRIYDPNEKPSALLENTVIGRWTNLWIPSEERTVGAKVELAGLLGTQEVSKKMQWKSWEVWVIASTGFEFYYDSETGFLVGIKNPSGSRWMLIETNLLGLQTN